MKKTACQYYKVSDTASVKLKTCSTSKATNTSTKLTHWKAGQYQSCLRCYSSPTPWCRLYLMLIWKKVKIGKWSSNVIWSTSHCSNTSNYCPTLCISKRIQRLNCNLWPSWLKPHWLKSGSKMRDCLISLKYGLWLWVRMSHWAISVRRCESIALWTMGRRFTHVELMITAS